MGETSVEFLFSSAEAEQLELSKNILKATFRIRNEYKIYIPSSDIVMRFRMIELSGKIIKYFNFIWLAIFYVAVFTFLKHYLDPYSTYLIFLFPRKK